MKITWKTFVQPRFWLAVALIGLILGLSSCAAPIDEKAKAAADNKATVDAISKWKVVEYDGCQYIVYDDGEAGLDSRVYSMTHKGNCTNPDHD